VIAADTNILVYAYTRAAPEHEAARSALTRLARSGETWGIPWTVASELIAFLTNGRIIERPLSTEAAFTVLDRWLDAGGARLLLEPPSLYPRFREVALAGRVRGPLVHDARIAAACLANGVSEFWTADRDYSRFPGLRVVNPLVG
jgi:toxin-antitoxin system PIN domain toxin